MSKVVIENANHIPARTMWAHGLNCPTTTEPVSWQRCRSEWCDGRRVIVFTDPKQAAKRSGLANNLARLMTDNTEGET